MWLSAVITPHVPYLRRFARSLTGTQAAGDACVASTLEAIIANPAGFMPGGEPRVALYRLFLRVLRANCATGVRRSPGTRTTILFSGRSPWFRDERASLSC